VVEEEEAMAVAVAAASPGAVRVTSTRFCLSSIVASCDDTQVTAATIWVGLWASGNGNGMPR
jgi:hypothetical protein